MTTPSSPLEAFQSAARTVLGRLACFCGACVLGGATGYLLDYSRQDETGPSWQGFLFTATVVPMAFASFLTSYGLIVFPVCLFFAFAFIRLELSLRWLALPFVLVAWQALILEVAAW
jgi:hypothetical protein